MIEPIVVIRSLSRRFGRIAALEDVSLDVQPGIVLGLVGENGAGKTTLIKHILGLLRAKAGTVRVFGLDPVKDPVYVLGRIGYLSEERDLPDWMSVSELLWYTKAFYPRWDDAYAEELLQSFGLDPAKKIKTLSQGQRAQAALLAAVAHRPELLVLDEPSSGLDAVVRRDILGAVIRTVAEEGRTVIFSSHLLHEVERVADVVAMIHKGKLVLNAPLDDLKARHRRIVLRFPEPQSKAPAAKGIIWSAGSGRDWTCVCDSNGASPPKESIPEGAEVVEESAASLEEIFVARVKGAGSPPRVEAAHV